MDSSNALILVVEDEHEIAEVIVAYLEREGFRTVRASDGRTALDLHLALKPDLITLDVHLPRMSGWDVLAEVRRRGATPVIMLTALDQDIDKLQALRVGADDYVVKPFNAVEVAARARAVLRRVGNSHGSVLRVGAVEIDLESHAASVIGGDGQKAPLALTLTEFRILAHMARAPRRAFSRAELVDACLPGGEALERTADTHLSKLRRKLEEAGAHGFVRNIRGVGFRLAQDA
ncbi:response regulator transcription factor [Sphingomonas kyeonggiensis]|uniref:Two-component system response regulator AdeR n=1 Tax=Sphingomonas kyeonggiensis TaxID=1268553 RepID=A0A7W6NVR0_9SPHN|nr:response regulator transcription factor [Sphingomonas kyeonggiensis]MBB4096804.1 two-component system response regulator AdeR [Sphingomonas kyeonggiensis]